MLVLNKGNVTLSVCT